MRSSDKTNKDIIFVVLVLLWFIAGCVAAIHYGSVGIVVVNMVGCLVMGILILIKNTTKIGIWMERKWKEKK